MEERLKNGEKCNYFAKFEIKSDNAAQKRMEISRHGTSDKSIEYIY